MIQFNTVTKHYSSGHQALSQVSFKLPEGQMAFLTGHSGAGKSTLLKLIAMIEMPTQGDILVDGKLLSRISPKHRHEIRQQIGLIFQDPMLLEDRSVFDNVALPLMISGYRYQEIGRRVRAALDKVGLLAREKHFPCTLSCGEQQRIGIARAVVRKPAIILADEPTGNLDPELAKNIMQLFESFNQVGTTILIASHNQALIDQMEYPVMELKEGRMQ
jgi:cell division transport system ATP-binding protein